MQNSGTGGVDTSHLALALVAVTSAARAMGRLFERTLRQPPVIGEIVLGILLGPSALGLLAPRLQAFLLPESVVPQLSLLAHLGVLMFMFLLGLDLELSTIAKKSGAAVLISHASIAAPLLLGAAAGLGLYTNYAQPGVDKVTFALFVGLTMAVTAFPVLARIMATRNLEATSVGRLALLCAAVDDATAWCLLALVLGLARARLDTAAVTFALTAVYGFLMLRVGRPAAARWVALWERRGRSSSALLVFALTGLFLSAFVTEWIGIHALFGAFVWGLVLPKREQLVDLLRGWMAPLVQSLFLPLFFVCSGLHTRVDLLASWSDWLSCAVVIAIATAGKLGGTYCAARWARIPHLEALTLGALMNTRGLVGLIVLDVGFRLGLLSAQLFAMLVIMALVTTFVATPLLDYVSRRTQQQSLRAAVADASS